MSSYEYKYILINNKGVGTSWISKEAFESMIDALDFGVHYALLRIKEEKDSTLTQFEVLKKN